MCSNGAITEALIPQARPTRERRQRQALRAEANIPLRAYRAVKASAAGLARARAWA